VLWFGKPGTPNGPQERSLHRTPIRRDVYTPANLANSTMPGIQPYEDPGNFTYQRELTGAAFNTLRQHVKVLCIDSHEEMKAAWLALRDAGMPADALAVFSDVSIMQYAVGGKGDPEFDCSDALQTADHAARIGEWFRANYRKAEAMARGISLLYEHPERFSAMSEAASNCKVPAPTVASVANTAPVIWAVVPPTPFTPIEPRRPNPARPTVPVITEFPAVVMFPLFAAPLVFVMFPVTSLPAERASVPSAVKVVAPVRSAPEAIVALPAPIETAVISESAARRSVEGGVGPRSNNL
jgi:hypothetical protein